MPLQNVPRAHASSSSSAAAQNAGPHLVSLKVMRTSAPSLAVSEKPYCDRHSTYHDELITAVAQGIDDAASHDLLSNRWDTSPSPADQFPISELLVLPNSFGTLYLGETFRTYLCVRNESSTAVREPSLRVEMQVGASDPHTQEGGRWVQLAHVILSTPTRYSPEPDQDKGRPVWELRTAQALETSLAYDIKDLGPHVLVCTVGYKSPLQQDGDVAWVERSFRKFYKFSVDRSPISVRTKVHQPRHASSLFHPDAAVRKRVELEVQVQNTAGNGAALVLNELTLKPAPGWKWVSVDRPSLNDADRGDEDMWILRGTDQVLADGDVRQYLFVLTPENKDQTLAEEVMQGGIDLGVTKEGLALRGDALGHLDISWRMALGEAGRLQTSQLVRRRVVTQPVTVASGLQAQIPLEPQLAARLTLQPTSLETLRSVRPGDVVELDFDVAVCDVSGLMLPTLQDGTWMDTTLATPEIESATRDDDDDDDDDTPLSEIVSSPRAVGKRISSTTVNTDTSPPRSSDAAEHVMIRRTLHLALQHCSIEAPTAMSTSTSVGETTMGGSQEACTPRKSPLPSRTSTPTQNNMAGVSALNKARLQANLTSLVRNTSLSSLRVRGSVDEGDRSAGGRATPLPPAVPPKGERDTSAGAADAMESRVAAEARGELTKTLPLPSLSWEAVVKRYRVYMETHSQALNRPSSAQPMPIPRTFLPSDHVQSIGSTLVPLAPISFDIALMRLANSSLYRSHTCAHSPQSECVPAKLGFYIPADAEHVVRFGAVRVVLISYADSILRMDGKQSKDDAAQTTCMTVVDEMPVVAETLLVTH